MGYNESVPQDRATAQVAFVFGSLLLLGGIAGLVFVDWSLITRRGIPWGVLAWGVTVFGIVVLWNGVRMWRKDGKPDVENDTDQALHPQGASGSKRVARVIPTVYFAVVGASGGVGVVGGCATLVTGLIAGDETATTTGILIAAGGLILGLVGISAAAHFKPSRPAGSSPDARRDG